MSTDESILRLKISAPGKVILFGEHSVVHNKPAIAATLGLRTRLNFSETNTGLILLSFPSVGLKESFPVNSVKEYFRFCSNDSWEDYFKNLLGNFERFHSNFGGKKLTENQKTALVTFFHCFSNLPTKCKGFDLSVESDLPVGSGVGSSASFSVVLSTASLTYKWVKEKEAFDNFIIR